jgi:thymidylate kinase
MRETRLILVDGVPRSGKSTIAEHVTRELEQRGIPCRLLREREPDPLGPA